MFPLEFDHSVLDSLPLSLDEDIKRVVQVVKAIIARRVVPYFKKKRGTDAILAARVAEQLAIERMEDEGNRVRGVSLVAQRDKTWVITVHERIFDYLAFVIPSHPDANLAEGTPEMHKMLAFAEFMLRHQVQHVLYPESTENDVIVADAAFAMDRRSNDPTFYRELRQALSDEMNGLKGEGYLALFDCAEQSENTDNAVSRILNDYTGILVDFPEALLQNVFPSLCTNVKTRVLGLLFQRSRDTSYPLVKRTTFLQRFLRLFELLMAGDEKGAEQVFDGFKDRWGLVNLFHELGLPEAAVENKTGREIVRLVKQSLKQYSEETKGLFCDIGPQPVAPRPEPKPVEPAVKTLKDRIAEIRSDPSFPAQVIELIEKNKLNAVGHSGYKYTELIETLLAFPWSKLRPIQATPEDFEKGINSSHYGLEKPKETILDFFTSLIWRHRQRKPGDAAASRRTGSAFLFVGPPGVGKTSFAISIAENLGVPYHKLSLGGMRDEADLRGHGFTYEGSKPGAIVQGLIKMGCINGMFIMDEADKTEKFAIATLLEILDPEQNHLFHDKYTQSTIDIDLSNCHFILTANTLETVPPPVINRCEVVYLDRYSVDEKICIAREHLIRRVRERYQIGEGQVSFDPEHESGLLKFLVKSYTHEAGVRELERVIRTLFMRILRKEILAKRVHAVCITREKIMEYLELPRGPRRINEEDRVGEMIALGINVERGVGSIIPVQATPIHMADEAGGSRGFLSMIHATGNIERVMDESRKVATTAILHCAGPLGIDLDRADSPIHLHFMGGSTPKDGPSAGGTIALALASVLSGRRVRRDVAMTGEIDTQGRITIIGGLDVKLETAYDAGCRTMIIPTENLFGEGGVERLSEALKQELHVLSYRDWKDNPSSFDYTRHTLQILGVDHIVQASDIAFIDEEELLKVEASFLPHARMVREALVAGSFSVQPEFRVVYVKDPQELVLDSSVDHFWEKSGCVFLVRPPAGDVVRSAFPELEMGKRLWDFDPKANNLGSMLHVMSESADAHAVAPLYSSLVAPFFFLVRDRETLDSFSPSPRFERLRLFANNFTVQGVKIRDSKAILNRVCLYLSGLNDELLDACPFLGVREGIHVIDMSFIPEKYRLDLRRAETIVGRSLQRWLHSVEGTGDRDDTLALAIERIFDSSNPGRPLCGG